ncbi:MAG: hypothetical protein ABSB19_13495 [Methylomonas sp.]|jgi:preprotein translocase subunit SecG
MEIKKGQGSTPVVLPHAKYIKQAVAEELKQRSGGGGGDMSDLERRVGNLEADLRAMRDSLNTIGADIAVIKSNYVTRADLSEAMLSQTKWIAGILFIAIGLIFSIQRFYPSKPEANSVQQSMSQPPAIKELQPKQR